MPSALVSIDIQSASEDVFDLIHDYPRRLEWDPFLREARLLNGAKTAEVGASSRCTARRTIGGAAMDTVYITFSRPTIAAVSMTCGPWFLKSFAASIRQDCNNDGVVRVTYRYNFKAFPSYFSWLIEPIVHRVLHSETSRRLLALKQFIEHG